jgi:hypothetical protein
MLDEKNTSASSSTESTESEISNPKQELDKVRENGHRPKHNNINR